MADILDVLAVTGEKIILLLTGTDPGAEAVTGPVDVSFKLRTDGDPIVTLDFWNESLVAEAADPSDPPGTVGRIPWKVNLNGVFTMPKSPDISIINFSLTGKTPSGKPLNVQAGNRLRIPALRITSNAKLRRIMKHEFTKSAGADRFAFDEAPVQEALDLLDPAQRKLLATHDPGPTGNRLVAFATLVKENNLRMHADTCPTQLQPPGPPDSVKPNATFMVFHCQGAGKPVALACFTRYFVLNLINPMSRSFVDGPQNGKKADDWLARSNSAPPTFKIGAFCRSGAATGTDGVFWNRIYNSKGKNIMGGNTMHGKINTVGCWMLFRNYNFPKRNAKGEAIEDEMDRILNRLSRPIGSSQKKILDALKAIGYDAASSRDKFIGFDQNHAYAMFFRDVVGMKYFSKTMNGWRAANDVFAHQLFFSPFFDPDAVERVVEEIGDGDFIYHDLDMRLKDEKDFVLTEDNIVENALGFKTCAKYALPQANDVPQGEMQDRTWCDLFVYREDDFFKRQFQRVFTAKI
jgi:hypothetical protein